MLPSLQTVGITFLFACGQKNGGKTLTQEINRDKFTVDTFSTFPPEIDGCSCYFSNDSIEFEKGIYIYMNDYSKTSFLKINDALMKFTQTELKEVDSTKNITKAKNDLYELIIETKYLKQSGYETYLNTGTIILKDKQGNTVQKKFYGECGC